MEVWHFFVTYCTVDQSNPAPVDLVDIGCLPMSQVMMLFIKSVFFHIWHVVAVVQDMCKVCAREKRRHGHMAQWRYGKPQTAVFVGGGLHLPNASLEVRFVSLRNSEFSGSRKDQLPEKCLKCVRNATWAYLNKILLIFLLIKGSIWSIFFVTGNDTPFDGRS